MKQKLKITGILFISFIVHVAGQNVSLSLSEAIRNGLENNPGIQNARIDTQKAQSQLVEQQSKLYPQVNAYSDFYYYYGLPKLVVPGEIFGQSGDIPVEFGTKYDWSSGFRATQVLYNQSYFTSLKIARQNTEVEHLNLQQKKEELIYQISLVYYLCLTTRQQTKHLSTTLKNMDKLLQITKLQEQVGIIRKVDREQVLVDQNNLQTEIDNLNQLYEQQINLLKYLTGINLNINIELTDSLTVPESINEDVQAWENRTEMKLLDAQLERARLSLKMSKQEYFPVLSGFAQYYYQGQRDRFDFFDGGNDRFYKVGFVGISLSIPIFNGFEKREKMRQHKLAIQQLQNSRIHTLGFFSKEHKNAWLQYENNQTTLRRQEENIRIAEGNYRIVLLEYQQQTTSLSDLLRAQNSLTEACLSYDNALLQLKNAALDLIKAKGELLTKTN
ncbi:MAG: TolC family protein [Massilibacteroides sp.]|nr:TolC family protein [Massilibacteroides sp.]